jgi:hypothetical protein
MRELATEAMTTEERREMMAITTKSSIKVNPLLFLEQPIFSVYQKVFFEQRKKYNFYLIPNF